MTKILCMVVNLVGLHTETLKKPIDDLTKLFTRLRKNKNFSKKEIITLKHIRCSKTF